MANFTIPYTTPANYTYDNMKITVENGLAKLKLQNSLQSFVEDFADDTGFTYDSNLAEFVGGKVQQKDKRPTDATFYASYNTDINGNWGNGILTGTPIGGASVSGGKLDLAHNDKRYVDYDAIGNANSQQVGCVRFKVTPNYFGQPDTRWFFAICKAHNDIKNTIELRQSGSNSYLRLHIYDKDGNFVVEHLCGTWNPIVDTEYEFELNWDFTTGATRLFINGIQNGSTCVSTCLRDSNIGLLRIGSDYDNGSSDLSNFKINDFLVFSTVQHTSNYTPNWSNIYEYDYVESTVILPEMEHVLPGDLTTFVSFVTVESGNPRYTLQIGRSGNYLYWNGSIWTTSDGSYNQANDATTFNAHVDDLDVEGETYGQFKIHFDNSNTLSYVDNLIANLYMDIGYPTTKPTIYKTDGDSIANIEEWITFTETLGLGNEGSVVYQLSEDAVTWKYWNGSIWTTAGITDYNSATVVNNNINDFPADTDKIYVKVFFLSNGLQQVELDLNEVGYIINTVPYVYAGTNMTAIYNVEITPFSDCLFSDAEGNITKAEWKIEGGDYAEISQGVYSTLLEAVQAFEYTPTHSGNKTIYLKITDSYEASSEDNLVINVNRVSISITIKDEYDNNIPNVLFNPGDGSEASLKSSPFTHVYYIGSWTATGTKNRFEDLSEAVTISIASTSLDFEMEKENLSYEISLTLPEKIFRGDSVTIDAKVDNNITGFKIRAEIFDNNGNSIKLANSASGGSDTEIEMVNPSIGEFSIYITKDTTDSFNLNSKIEIELVNTDDKVVTIYRGNLKFEEEQINWTTS